MKNGKIGYAVLGLGVGMAHAEAAFRSERADLVAVCDTDEKRLSAALDTYPGAKGYSKFDDLVSDPEIDIVSVCLPSGMHSEYAVKAMQAGKNVLVEKPVDITLEKAAAIDETMRAAGVRCGVCLQNRTNVNMRPMKDAIESGRLGRILFGSFAVKWYRTGKYFRDTPFPWRGTWEMDGGGSLMNQSIHTVDLMQWLMGEPESVTSCCELYDHNIETEDYTASIVRFRSGATATFTTTTCAYPGLATEICVYGSRGSIEADADKLKLWKLRDSDNRDEEEREMLKRFGAGNSSAECPVGHAAMVEDIISSVLDGHEPMVPPKEAMKSLAIALAIYESARTKKTVLL